MIHQLWIIRKPAVNLRGRFPDFFMNNIFWKKPLKSNNDKWLFDTYVQCITYGDLVFEESWNWNLEYYLLFIFIFLQRTKLRSKQNLWHLWLGMPTNLHIRLTLSLECWKINITYNIIFKILTSRFDNYQIAICDTLDINATCLFQHFHSVWAMF